jgi:hypothetical protein
MSGGTLRGFIDYFRLTFGEDGRRNGFSAAPNTGISCTVKICRNGIFCGMSYPSDLPHLIGTPVS